MDFTNAIPSNNGKPPSGIDGFDAATPAPEYKPLPGGVYTAVVTRGEYRDGRDGAYILSFRVTEGPESGSTIRWYRSFSANALSYSKRDIAPFGLTTQAKLLSPFPEAGREYHCRLVVALQRGDDGIARNDIKRIDLVRVVESPAAGFMMTGQSEGGSK